MLMRIFGGSPQFLGVVVAALGINLQRDRSSPFSKMDQRHDLFIIQFTSMLNYGRRQPPQRSVGRAQVFCELQSARTIPRLRHLPIARL